MSFKKINKETFIEEKPMRSRFMPTDPDFLPPDGGWGWLIVIACGFSNLSTFPMFQQFGLIFREKYEVLGISNTETTTIINLNSAFTACVGLLNGPVFKKYSYRQVALFGAILVFVSLLISAFCQSFWTYLIFYGVCYGSGIGITQSANALALNTYFKRKRRIATGFSWSATALGPIVWPYIIIALLGEYGTDGTLMIFSAFAGHAVICSLLLQPVHWHTMFRETERNIVDQPNNVAVLPQSPGVFSSQYLYNEDDPIRTGYEIIDPGTPRMVRANDGWYSLDRSSITSRLTLASRKSVKSDSYSTSKKFFNRFSYSSLPKLRTKKTRELVETPKLEELRLEGPSLGIVSPDLKEDEQFLLEQNTTDYENKEGLSHTAAGKVMEHSKLEDVSTIQKTEDDQYSCWEKIVIFFDLDLLKDRIYVNIMLGITIANFTELNFSILTPFVLQEFNFADYEIATFMSLLGATDILARFFMPFLADKIGWSNRTFFLVGILGMAAGRIVLVHTRVFSVSLGVAVMIGFGKGLRTVFMALVIPSHVPLDRLPAASGLHLATSGILFLILGPVVGWVRDAVNNYVITLHLLNIMTYITAITWSVEALIKHKRKTDNGTAEKC